MEINETSILVFSPTGNGLKVANHIKKTTDSFFSYLSNVTFPRVRENIEMKSKHNTLIIIIFPIYADSLPDIFSKFLSHYDFDNNPVILIAGYGNIYTGRALNDIKKIIFNNNGVVISAATIVLPHSYNSDKIQIAPNRPTNEEIILIDEFIYESIQKLSSSKVSELNQLILPKGHKRILSRFPQKFFPHIFIKKPDVDISLCNKCNICIDMCPAGAIESDFRINNSICIRCLACVAYCKNKARTFKTRSNILIHTLRKESREYHQNEFFI